MFYRRIDTKSPTHTSFICNCHYFIIRMDVENCEKFFQDKLYDTKEEARRRMEDMKLKDEYLKDEGRHWDEGYEVGR